MKVNYTKEERTEAMVRVKKLVEAGNKTVYCVLRRVSRSGMSRVIDFYTFIPNKEGGGVSKMWLSYQIAGILGYPFDKNTEAVKVSGCGMDMGFAVVHSLSCDLYPNKEDGGYVLKHEWI